MANRVAESEFVLILGSATYCRRFEGREATGIGKGAKWEGAIITQELYESEGHNERFIPIVLNETDVTHIPRLLAGQTHYNVNSAAAFGRLAGRLSGNTSNLRKVVKAAAQHRPEWGLFDHMREPSDVAGVPDAKIETARFILQVCKDGLPIDVLADAVDVGRDALERVFSESLSGVVREPDGHWQLDALSSLPEPPDAINCMGRALDALLAFIKRHRGDAKAEGQVQNAVQLAERCWTFRPKSVAPLFMVVDKLIKRRGDKRLVLRAANLSISAAQHAPLRTNAEVEAEARALVCGRAWVYQRTQKLSKASLAIQEAAQLGRDIGCSESIAFTTQCLGRLRRMEAEEIPDKRLRQELLKESANLLRDAIDRFERLDGFGPSHPDTGECFSLLGRTEFEAGNVIAAEHACRRALDILKDNTAKAWADLQILLGEIAANTDKRAALSYYDSVIAAGDPDDATHAELKARAYFLRGRAHKGLSLASLAIADFKTARAIWKGLGDPLANKAEWAGMWASGAVDKPFMDAFATEPFSVRVKAAHIHQERLETRRGTYVARRSDLTASYLSDLKKVAREAVALEEPSWFENPE